MKKYKRILFVFRQDMRVIDNTGLSRAINEAEEVVPCFVLDDTIFAKFPKDDTRRGFVCDGLRKVSDALQKIGGFLDIRSGDPCDIIPQLCAQYGCDAIYRNRSYGSGSMYRDQQIKEWGQKSSIGIKTFEDFLLVEPEEVPARKVYTPFYTIRKKVLQGEYHKEALTNVHPRVMKDGLFTLQTIEAITCPKFLGVSIENILKKYDTGLHPIRDIHGGDIGLKEYQYGQYNHTRNIPSIAGTSKFSPYTRFGLISIRQIWNCVIGQYRQSGLHGEQANDYTQYIKELAWRDFAYHILFHFPHTRTHEFQERKQHIQRHNNTKHFDARCNGLTGFPLVDAGMRQLRQENRIHNRVRMVVASFLTKDLLIDWRQGEQEFMRYLIDYDENVNINNRQWSASVGSDPKPMRIFNPNLQAERFDPTCAYIKKYIPELASYSPKQIFDPENNDLTHHGYVSPIISHKVQRNLAIALYKS